MTGVTLKHMVQRSFERLGFILVDVISDLLYDTQLWVVVTH